MTDAPEEPFGYEEFAHRTGMSADYARRHIKELPHFRPTPHRVKFLQKHVDEYIASVNHTPADPFKRTGRTRQTRKPS
jgi:hypothetical protein